MLKEKKKSTAVLSFEVDVQDGSERAKEDNCIQGDVHCRVLRGATFPSCLAVAVAEPAAAWPPLVAAHTEPRVDDPVRDLAA